MRGAPGQKRMRTAGAGNPSLRGDIVMITATTAAQTTTTSIFPALPRRCPLSSTAPTRADKSDRLAIASAGDFRFPDNLRASPTN